MRVLPRITKATSDAKELTNLLDFMVFPIMQITDQTFFSVLLLVICV